MALTASIDLGASTLPTGSRVSVTCTVSNDGDAPVSVTGIVPSASPVDDTSGAVPVALGAPNVFFPVSIPAGESVDFSWLATPQAPTGTAGLAAPANFEYALGALVYGSDGSLVAADAGQIAVTDPFTAQSPD